ncbi:MAG: iron export ABC transporter permease subunit FetB [Actinobacteria bacterium]|nr:iron export ABC transporter permease subunit FetB [Actinomycetota bacterium]
MNGWQIAVTAAPVAAQTQFTSLNVAVALLMVAIAVGLSFWQRLSLERDMLLACVRAFIQLLAIGYVIQLVFSSRSFWFVLLLVAPMIGFATFTSGRRLRGIPDCCVVAGVSITLASALTLVLLVALEVVPSTARYVVPLGGMVVDNAMNVMSVVGTRLREEMESERRLVEAARPSLRRAVRVAMIPLIDNTKTIGLVFLPGAMTGMILAGADPLDAVKLQAIVMYMLIGTVAIAAATAAFLVQRRLFTRQEQLRRLHAPRR